MAKCADLTRLQDQFSDAEASWRILRAPSVIAGISLDTNTDDARSNALSIRNAAAQDVYLHQKTCRNCLKDRSTIKK
jgi:hypothetical protein